MRLPQRLERDGTDRRALRGPRPAAAELRDRARLLRLRRAPAAARDREPRPEGRPAAVGAEGDRRRRVRAGLAAARDRRGRAARRGAARPARLRRDRRSTRTTAATAARPTSRRCRLPTRGVRIVQGPVPARRPRRRARSTASTRSRCSSTCPPARSTSSAPGSRRLRRAGGYTIHAIDHVLPRPGRRRSPRAPPPHRERARHRRRTSSTSCSARLADDPETYFLSAESHNRWRGARALRRVPDAALRLDPALLPCRLLSDGASTTASTSDRRATAAASCSGQCLALARGSTRRRGRCA